MQFLRLCNKKKMEYLYPFICLFSDQDLMDQPLKRTNLTEHVIKYCIESGTIGIISLALHAMFITFLNIAANNQVLFQFSLLFDLLFVTNPFAILTFMKV